MAGRPGRVKTSPLLDNHHGFTPVALQQRAHHLMPHLISLIVVIIGALLFASGFSTRTADQDILVGLGLVMLALVIARQFVTIRENERLNQDLQSFSQDLEEAVQARTASLAMVLALSSQLNRATSVEAVCAIALQSLREAAHGAKAVLWQREAAGTVQLLASAGEVTPADTTLPDSLDTSKGLRWLDDAEGGRPALSLIMPLDDATGATGVADLIVAIHEIEPDHACDEQALLTMGTDLCTAYEKLMREKAFLESQRSFRSLVQNSSDIITIVDTDLTIRYLCPSITRIMGYDPTMLIGKSLADYIHPDDAARPLEMVLRTLTQPGNTPPFAWRQRHSDGSWLHTETIGTNLLHDPDVRGIVLTTRDISERVELNERLAYQALHDPLTGLANRTLFHTQVELALKKMEQVKKPLAVLFLDLDNFKTINDSLGHAAGDYLLTVVATRLVQSLRANDVAARLGGDEFAVLLETMHDIGDAGEVANRIIADMRQPAMLDGKEIFANVSIGIALYDADGEDADGLLRNADMAMYTAKRRNKGHFEVFQPHMREAVLRRIQMEADLQKAIARQEFTLHYQPIIDMQTGKISSVEALVRWEHPTLGMIPPLEFISIAEEAGVIVSLGRWVLQEACKQAKRWQQGYTCFAELKINVNLSARQLQDEGLVDDVKTILLQSRLDPHTLVLEITESVLMVEIETAIERLRAIRDLGVQLAIDDFGTGYSSLSYLRDFPVDIIKIDKSFIDTIGTKPDADAILQTIAALGDTLNLHVVAEGIEEQRQFSHLQNLGCEYGQGYLFSKPLKQDALEALFQRESQPATEKRMAA